ncbi:MAG: HD-GYP domain-containing protein [Longimicrobiales bacterium]
MDDDDAVTDPLERIIRRAGYSNVRIHKDGETAVQAYHSAKPDLLLLDVHMPSRSGLEILQELNEAVPSEERIPIVMLTGDHDPAVQEQALACGAKDFIVKPFESIPVLLRLRNLLQGLQVERELRHQKESLEERVTERTRALAEAQVEILRRLALAAEYRDDVTGHHAERVGVLSALIADAMGLDGETIRLIRRAAPLHDVGKIGIPDAILMKPGPLSTAEFEVMKTHTTIGGRILSGSRFEVLQVARTIALNHHERWDGNGYNPGAGGDEIPLVGRIVAVADVFDSLCHERPYKPARPAKEAIDVITRSSGSAFDPQVVDAFLAVAGKHASIDVDMLISSAQDFGPPGQSMELADVEVSDLGVAGELVTLAGLTGVIAQG